MKLVVNTLFLVITLLLIYDNEKSQSENYVWYVINGDNYNNDSIFIQFNNNSYWDVFNLKSGKQIISYNFENPKYAGNGFHLGFSPEAQNQKIRQAHYASITIQNFNIKPQINYCIEQGNILIDTIIIKNGFIKGSFRGSFELKSRTYDTIYGEFNLYAKQINNY